MKHQYLFPVLLIVIQMCAGIVYGVSEDWRKAIYWIAAAVLNITVTF
jgi:type IV secretory pathway VirB2 component (pilin)